MFKLIFLFKDKGKQTILNEEQPFFNSFGDPLKPLWEVTCH